MAVIALTQGMGSLAQDIAEQLADELKLPRRSVALLRGDTSRRKQLAIALPPERLAEWLARVLADAAAP